jgi:hypothetical protein
MYQRTWMADHKANSLATSYLTFLWTLRWHKALHFTLWTFVFNTNYVVECLRKHNTWDWYVNSMAEHIPWNWNVFTKQHSNKMAMAKCQCNNYYIIINLSKPSYILSGLTFKNSTCPHIAFICFVQDLKQQPTNWFL